MPFVETPDGTRLYHRIVGRGEPVLFLTGLGTSHVVFHQQVAALRSDFRCVLVDHRGAGRSDRPDGPYSMAMLADDVIHLCRELGMARISIVGASMGAAVGQHIALAHPQRVGRLVLLNPWVQTNGFLRHIFQAWVELYARVSPTLFTQMVLAWILSPTTFAQRPDVIERHLRGLPPHRSPEDITGFEGQVAACLDHDIGSRRRDIDVHSLVIAGKDDILTGVKHARTAVKYMSGSTLKIVAEAGHAVVWEQPTLVNALLRSFLRGEDVEG